MICPRCDKEVERLVEYTDEHDVELVCDDCAKEMEYEDWEIGVSKIR